MSRMCEGKVRYPTEEAAIRCLLRRSREVGKLRYYECPICKGYHLTSKKLRTRRRRDKDIGRN